MCESRILAEGAVKVKVERNGGLVVVPNASRTAVRSFFREVSTRLSAEMYAYQQGRMPFDTLYQSLRYGDQTIYNQLLHAGPRVTWGVYPQRELGYGCWTLPSMNRSTVLAAHAVEVQTTADKLRCIEAMHMWVSAGRLPDCRFAWRAPRRWRLGRECPNACPAAATSAPTRCTCFVDRERLKWYPRNIVGAPFGFTLECEAVLENRQGREPLLARIKRLRQSKASSRRKHSATHV